MSSQAQNQGFLKNGGQLGPYPLHRLKRVEQPTTRIVGDVKRTDERETGFNKAYRGDYGPIVAREGQRFIKKFPLSAVLEKMTLHLGPLAEDEVAANHAPIPDNPEALSRHIKRLGYFLRADMIGICELPQYAVYSHNRKGEPIELNHKYAISILIDQDYETMLGSTGYDGISGSQSFMSYSVSSFIAVLMAQYIRKLGYAVRAHPRSNYQVALPPLLLLSGLGEISRMGDAIVNPFLGARFKAAAVTTDLPLVPDKPIDFGLQEFCRQCGKCSEHCPSKAITNGDKTIYNGYETWKLDVDRCTKFRVTNQKGSSCGSCIKVCPWNKPRGWIHDAVRWMVAKAPALDGLIVKMDDLWGYGNQSSKYKWWFDLEEIDGVISKPVH